MKIDSKSLLTRQRADILQGLVDLAAKDRKPAAAESYRAEAEHLVSELALTDKMLATATPHSQGQEYVDCKRPIDAILRYFIMHDRPATQGEITRAIMDGGFRGAVAGTEIKINRGFKSFLKGTGRAKGYIKQIGGLIGLADWDDSRFKSAR